MLLGDIAQVKTGLVLSRKKVDVEYETKATYNLITLKNITEDGRIDTSSIETFRSYDVLDDHYFTQEGDVLMRLSHPHTALYIGREHSGLLIPSYFAIIKVDQSKFIPEYIAWYLNTNEAKMELERSQAGSRIPSTNQNVLKAIPVAWPTLSKQKKLIELYRLHLREKVLYKRLIEEKVVWFNGISQQILMDSK